MRTREDLERRRVSHRLALQFAALIMALFALLGGVVFVIVSASQAESTQRMLVDGARVDSPHDAPRGVFVVMITHGTMDASGDLPPGLPDRAALDRVTTSGRALQQTRTLGDHTFVIRTAAEGGRVTQVAVDLHEDGEELQRLGLGLVVSGIVAAVAAGLIAAWMSRRAMQPLADALALQRRFVMDASHELRTPLTLLSTRAQLVRRRLPTSVQQAAPGISEGLEEIVQDSRLLSEVLEDLLIAADPRLVAEKTRIDLATLADETVASFRSEADDRHLVLRRSGATDPVSVVAARVAIQRLFTALITNALDHAQSVIEVAVAREGREAIVRISDDGPGFPQGMDERAFERFASSRPLGAEQERARHYGLGLALVAEVAARHNGGVSIETNEQGHGASVVIRIPAEA